VKTDPATTAFAAMALMRVGNTPTSGSHQDSVRRALLYLVETVEEAPAKGPKITDITGTQPQTKLGQIVDTSMTAQFLARALKSVPEESDLHARVDKALTKCVDKLQKAQGEKGGWNLAGGGWAPVLQSSWACNALELASAVGNKAVQPKALEKARDNQKMAVDTKTGKASAKDAAGVELYAFAGGQRAAAGENRAAEEIVRRAKEEGKLAEDAEVDEDSLRQAGVDAPKAAKLAQANAQFKAQVDRLDDKQLLKGFGNNGGEEFMSFLLTGESLVIAGGDRWNKWYDKMVGLTKEAQNPDGSWSGHHCITSPVFSTAAVVQVLTVDRDAELLIAIAEQSEQDAKKTAKK